MILSYNNVAQWTLYDIGPRRNVHRFRSLPLISKPRERLFGPNYVAQYFRHFCRCMMTPPTSLFSVQAKHYVESLGSPTTRARYQAALKEFDRWYVDSYGQKPDAALLVEEEARDWRSHLLAVRSLGAASVNLRLSALKGLARQYGRTLNVKGVRKQTPPPEPLNGRQLGRLLAAADGPDWLHKRNVAAFSLMARAGLRVSEVVNLKLDDVALSQRRGSAHIRHGKGLKERTVPLSSQARKDFTSYLALRPSSFTGPWAFLTRNGGQLSARDLQRAVSKAGRLAGLTTTVTPHTLRHTFATRALRQGKMDLATLATVLGHENLITTARYLHPDRAGMAAMLEDL